MNRGVDLTIAQIHELICDDGNVAAAGLCRFGGD